MNKESAPRTRTRIFLLTVLFLAVLFPLAQQVVGSPNRICSGEVVTIEGTDRDDEIEGNR